MRAPLGTVFPWIAVTVMRPAVEADATASPESDVAAQLDVDVAVKNCPFVGAPLVTEMPWMRATVAATDPDPDAVTSPVSAEIPPPPPPPAWRNAASASRAVEASAGAEPSEMGAEVQFELKPGTYAVRLAALRYVRLPPVIAPMVQSEVAVTVHCAP